MNENQKVPKRIAQTVLNSLKGGVVPRIGLPYIAVGRKNEIEALLHDVEIIAEGGASFRFIVGRYGSGKSFLIQTIRNYVMDKGFIVADADLSPERRLQGTRGQGLATYRELIGNLSTKTRPEGGALTLVLDRWISGVQAEAVAETGLTPGRAQHLKLAPVIEESPVNIECRVTEIKELGSHHMFLAEVLGVSVDEEYLNEKGRFELNQTGLIAYSHGTYMALGEPCGSFGWSVKRKKKDEKERSADRNARSGKEHHRRHTGEGSGKGLHRRGSGHTKGRRPSAQ